MPGTGKAEAWCTLVTVLVALQLLASSRGFLSGWGLASVEKVGSTAAVCT